MLAPYYGPEHGYRFDSLAALRFLLPVLDLDIKQVGFWFFPGQELLELCRSLKLEVVDEWGEGTALGAVNAYPLAAASLPHQPCFWLDERGNRTPFYGGFYEPRRGPITPTPSEELWLMVLLLMIPVLGLLLTKLLNPGFFSNQLNLLLSPQLFLDNSLNTVYLGPGSQSTLSIIRLCNMIAALTLGLYYLHVSQAWARYEFIGPGSLLYETFATVSHPGWILLMVMGFLLSLEALRFVIIQVFQLLFQLKGSYRELMIIDVVAHFPLLWLLPSALIAALFMDSEVAKYVESVLAVLLLLYWLRLLYVNFLGLSREGTFSSGTKFLYICTFNIATVLIWL